ncbi:MAG: hypothetical protein APF83_11235 [Lutibacter sp. BRH_c52]|nr:MAG: hypothetical protein APF83_11235 [Lutibacter sp. BRH_c52]
MEKKLPLILIIISIIFLVINLSELDFGNLKDNSYTGIISNILLITAMILLLITNNKKKDLI